MRRLKRGLDIAIAGGALMAFSPVFAVLWLLIRVRMGSPVMFRQERGGRGNQPFHFYKLRTMTDDRDPKTGELLPDHVRLTPLGKWLRETSLDELPQLWNVLRGDMSIVGPRPLLAEYLPLYDLHQRRRHEVRPGITGWAQVNGRNSLNWLEKFEMDVWYVDHWSLLLDLRILWRTLAVAVVRRSGVDHADEVTMPRFTGC